MPSYSIEIRPQKKIYDPLAKQIENELIERGVSPKEASVETNRIFKLEGDLPPNEISSIVNRLLLDPIVETAVVVDHSKKNDKKKKGTKAGWTLDVSLKSGVTDPISDTIIKGLEDLGYRSKIKASTAQRYVFPKIKNEANIKSLAEQILANKLIHDIDIRKSK